MDNYYLEELLKVLIAFVVGAVVGIEREYRSKPAGFRTMIMICVGSCVFTILSKEISSASPDRIASNIVTGIGFIGAGVIFKEGLSINGLTTAALIWVTAALGMAAGSGNYVMVSIVSMVVLVTLFVLEKIYKAVDKRHRVTIYKIIFSQDQYSREELEQAFKDIKINFHRLNLSKKHNEIELTYRITSNQEKYDRLNELLMNSTPIKGFTA
jgi:putative Mg2+ transporter-C (MgtC) family protein